MTAHCGTHGCVSQISAIYFLPTNYVCFKHAIVLFLHSRQTTWLWRLNFKLNLCLLVTIHMSQELHCGKGNNTNTYFRACQTYDWLPVIRVKKCSFFRNTWFHSLCVHDFTHSLYMNYRICQSWDYVHGLMTGLFAWISLTALSWTFCIINKCFLQPLLETTSFQVTGKYNEFLNAIMIYCHKYVGVKSTTYFIIT